MDRALETVIDQALARRADILARTDTNVCRLFHGGHDGVEGVIIERLGDVLVAQIHEGRLQVSLDRVRRLAEGFRERLGAAAVYRKWFVRDRARPTEEQSTEHARAQPWIGHPVEPEMPIRENGLNFLIRPFDGYSVGLFLEHRETRRRIRDLSARRRVLNTFAYTCGFSVAAAIGGAAETASVDLHKRYLEWGKRNFTANGLDLASHRFFASDTFEFFQRARRQGRRYDLVVLDPPTFARLRRPAGVFVLDERLETLVAGAADLLDSGGIILLAVNDRAMPLERLEKALNTAAGRRTGVILERPVLPPDFAGDVEYAKSIVARID